jgi:hypothetical protein
MPFLLIFYPNDHIGFESPSRERRGWLVTGSAIECGTWDVGSCYNGI